MKSRTYVAATLFAALAVGAPVFGSTQAQSAQRSDRKGQQENERGEQNECGERQEQGERGERNESRESSRAQERLARQARITLEQARATALQREAGTIESEELEREHGRLVYSFDIRNGRGTISEIQVNAIDGAIVSVEEETPEQERAERADADEREDADEDGADDQEENEDQATLRREARITVEQARATALNREPGTVESEELERENGNLVYSFDIRNRRGTISEVQVNALDGVIVSVDEETAEQEATERAQEQRERERRNNQGTRRP